MMKDPQTSLTVSAPAKINLSLRILRRREDGFHELETLMVPLGLADSLTMERLAGRDGEIEFSCSESGVPADDTNLVMRALMFLARECGPLPALKIHLEKRIPHGAGLGGGSSDAAAALCGVRELLGLTYPDEVWAAVAARVGSDVPFFLHRGAAWCRGRGELIEPRPGWRLGWPVLLIKPPFPVPTPWAYQQWQGAPCLPGVDYDPQTLVAADGTEVVLVNDLERPVFAKHLLLPDLKMWLRARPEVSAALMSGSGSTLFAVLRDDGPATVLREDLAREYGPHLWTWQGLAG